MQKNNLKIIFYLKKKTIKEEILVRNRVNTTVNTIFNILMHKSYKRYKIIQNISLKNINII